MKTSLKWLGALLVSVAFATGALAAEKVDINTADAASLDRALTGVGPSKAEAIVAHRKQHGAFRSADELAEVKGIGLSIVEQNRERISVGSAAARPAAAKAPAKAPAVPAAGGG